MHLVRRPAQPIDAGLSRYLREIRHMPILTAEEEFRLAKLLRDHADRSAEHRLVASHLRLVAKMAVQLRHYGLPLEDMISEGNLGLMSAVRRFDPDVGARLATYAMWWIKAALNEYVLNNWSMARLGTTSATKKLFFHLRRLKEKLGIVDSNTLSDEDADTIAHELNVPRQDVLRMNERMAARDLSLNVPIAADTYIEYQDILADGRPDAEALLVKRKTAEWRRALLDEALKRLDKRELDILSRRRLRDDPPTLKELAIGYGVSRERIRQIEDRAFRNIQTILTKDGCGTLA